MPKLFKTLAVLLALPLVLTGCKINSINYFAPTPAHVRVVNVLGSTTPINITVNGVSLWSGLAFEAMTGYQDIENAPAVITVSLVGETAPLLQQTYSAITGDQSYTLVVFGTPTAPSLGVMIDVVKPPPSGKFLLSFFGAAPLGNGTSLGTTGLDLYLTPPGQALDTLSPQFSGIQYTQGNFSGEYASGQYQLRLTIAGTKTVIYDSGPLTFQEKTATDVIIYSRGSAILANVLLNDSDGAGQQVIANNLLARQKAVNAASQAGPVNQFFNGTAKVADLAYPAASTYKLVASGPGTVTFEATAAPGATIASLAKTFAGGTDQSIFVAGFAGATSAIALVDNNFPPASGFGAVRYVNASPDSAPLDVYANDVKLTSALGTYAASAYIQMLQSTYTITFKDSVTGVTVLTLSNVLVAAQQTFTVYVVGAAGPSLAGLVTPDTP